MIARAPRFSLLFSALTRRSLALLLAALAGSNSLPAAAAPQVSLPALRPTLEAAPPLLRNALAAGLAVAPAAAATIADDSAGVADGGPDATRTLRTLIAGARTPALQPDTGFAAVVAVFSGTAPAADLFATSLASFLTDPAFSCRQPLLADYFRQRYAASSPAPACTGEVPFQVASLYDGMQVVWIDPRRVRSIQVLFAGKGPAVASRFGHIALRLVVCPGADSTTADCDANLREHLVLGFQAHINELGLDMLKALTGGYRAYLFSSRFLDAYQDYAIGEFREVYSLPLRLEDGPREHMVRKLAELHWRYNGGYRFFTRNCTTLLQQALRLLLPEAGSDRALRGHYLRPDHFFAALRRSPLAEGERLLSLEQAERDGLFFSSTQPFYEQAAEAVRAGMQQPDFRTLAEYLHRDPLHRRRALATDAVFGARLVSDVHLRDAQLMLEELAFLRSEQRLKRAAARYFRDDFPARSALIQVRLDAAQQRIFNACLLGPIAQMLQPLPRHDGIPDRDSLPGVNIAVDCLAATALTRQHEALALLRDDRSAGWRDLAAGLSDWKESLRNVEALRTPAAPLPGADGGGVQPAK